MVGEEEEKMILKIFHVSTPHSSQKELVMK